MATRKTKQLVEESMAEVFDNPPSTLKAGKSPEARRKQQIAIGLSKARQKGARVPRKRGSTSSY